MTIVELMMSVGRGRQAEACQLGRIFGPAVSGIVGKEHRAPAKLPQAADCLARRWARAHLPGRPCRQGQTHRHRTANPASRYWRGLRLRVRLSIAAISHDVAPPNSTPPVV